MRYANDAEPAQRYPEEAARERAVRAVGLRLCAPIPRPQIRTKARSYTEAHKARTEAKLMAGRGQASVVGGLAQSLARGLEGTPERRRPGENL